MSNLKNDKPGGIFIVDDHDVVRQGLKLIIGASSDFVCVGEAADEQKAIEGIIKTMPDVVLLDISLKRTDGLNVITKLRAHKIRIPVVVLSMHEESIYAYKAMRMGAAGYIMKSEPADVILNAISLVLKGGKFLSERVKDSVLHRVNCAVPTYGQSMLDDLSSRERQIFILLGRGFPPRCVASELGISKKTIDTHRFRMIQKLGLDSGHSLIMTASNWCHAEGITAGMI